MRSLLLIIAFGCSNKSQDKPPPDPTPASAPVAPVAIDAVAAPAVDAAAAPDAGAAESKYGYCEMTFTGAINETTRVAMQPRWVASDYWLSKKTKTQDAKTDKAIKREGFTVDATPTPFTIHCDGGDKRLFLDIKTSKNTKLAQIKQKPADYPIEYHLEAKQKPGQIIGEVLSSLAPLYPSSGTLHITRFEHGELEATFEMEAASIREPPDKVKIVGKIVYHCADYDRCGAG